MTANIINIVVTATDRTSGAYRSVSAESRRVANAVRSSEEQMRSDANRTASDRNRAADRVVESNIRVERAEERLASAVRRSGPNSSSAREAAAQLNSARNQLSERTDRLNRLEGNMYGSSLRVAEAQERLANETRRLGQAQESTGTRSDGLRRKLGQVATTAAGMITANILSRSTAALSEFIKGSVKQASDLIESTNAVNQVFAKSAPTILEWGKSNSAAFGLSQQAFNALVTPMGAILQNTGLSMKDSTKWTIDLTKRASDMASVFNTDVGDAMRAIQSGLRGQVMPLERYGVGIHMASVKAEALSMGLGKTTGNLDKIKAAHLRAEVAQNKYIEAIKKHGSASNEAKSAHAGLLTATTQLDKATSAGSVTLTAKEKSMARLHLIMRETKATEGDFARTSGNLANSQRIATAKTEDLQAKIGVKLIPAVLLVTKAKMKLVDIISDRVLPAVEKLVKWAQTHPTGLKAVAAVISGVLITAFTLWTAAALQAAAATAAATWPILLVVAVVAALAAGVAYAYTHWKAFHDVVDNLVVIFKAVVLPVIKTVAEFLGKVLVKGLNLALFAWSAFAEGVLNMLGGILHAAAWAFQWVPGLGPKLKNADAKFGAWKDSVVAKLRAVQKNAVVNIKGNTSSIDNNIKAVKARLIALGRDPITIPINAGGYGQGLGVYKNKATGGVVGSAATGGARSGLTMVGEAGPELVKLPAGSHVMSAPDTLAAKENAAQQYYESHKKSPTKQSKGDTHAISEDLTKGLAAAIKQNGKAVTSAMADLMDDVRKVGSKGATAVITTYKRKLLEVAKKRDALDQDLLAAVTEARKKYVEAVNSTRESIISGSGGAGQSSNFSVIVGKLQTQVDNAKQFAIVLSKLRKAGLDKTSIAQLVEAGPEAGLAAARSILASGGAGIKQLSGLQNDLASAGGLVGTVNAETQYRQGIVNAEKALKNNAAIAALDKQMEVLASSLTKALKKHIKGLATGGIVGTAATGGPRSNRTLVGEYGPELVDLPSGSRVRSSPDTERIFNGSRGGGSLQIEWVGSNGGDEFVSWLRKNIRIRGGNVQTVLGVSS